ncbi:LacI family DNA-binding transcriptional regulator [Kaistia geumhonensis]|uniref:LacI family transcriptional regulator n=1 Tax=Kaistia geumhonensis TaxID=410839 RepID=A0ABU0M5H8_9HYPH|nr:LacI family DNA-binding transcriptional regulator [Kaistia geumhonensis]MCX5478564.1 LacI family DNA-binding transcriptional regulator [Kaistia geumhonensis]MDQ0516218.1 LacI family transcriptional regulator [Kaistia geumhonensis]
MPTIKDVAQRAGVAISTVSAVINRSAPVSEEVIQRVEDAIAAIGYLPHGAAKALRSGDSRLIGLILPDITNPFFSTVARVIETVCMRAGYMTFVYNTDEDVDHEMRILKMMRAQRVAGMILISTRSDAEHGQRLMSEINVPTVLFSSNVPATPYDAITLNEAKASRIAIDYLAGLGHRRIGVLSGRPHVSTHEERLEACLDALRAHGIEPQAELIVAANFDQSQAFEACRALLALPEPPSAIFAFSNLMMVGMMRAVVSSGLACPRDISLVGIGDFEWPEIMNPQMTVVSMPAAEMAECAIETLLDQIASKRPPTGRRIMFDPRLVIRESTAAPLVPLPA